MEELQNNIYKSEYDSIMDNQISLFGLVIKIYFSVVGVWLGDFIIR